MMGSIVKIVSPECHIVTLSRYTYKTSKMHKLISNNIKCFKSLAFCFYSSVSLGEFFGQLLLMNYKQSPLQLSSIIGKDAVMYILYGFEQL